MIDQPPGEGWWLASDGNWYPPEQHPDRASQGLSRGAARPGTEPHRAGASADRKAQELNELAEQHIAEAKNWAKGAEGERRTAARLAELGGEFVVFHDLHVPGSEANVDHLVIGPNGVWVVDSKAYAGEYRDGDGTLWNGKFPIRSEVDTLNFITARVAAHLEVPVRGVLCFTEAALPRPVTELGAVLAVTLDALIGVLTAGSVVFNDAQVRWYSRLASELTEPLTLSPSAADGYELHRTSEARSKPTKPQPARTARARSAPARSNKKRSPSLAGLLISLVVGGFVLFVVLPAFVKAMANSVAKNATTTVPAAVPGVGVQLLCPGPGAGYTAAFVWPPGGVTGLEQYTITVTANGAPIASRRWTIEAVPPEPIPGLAPGTPLVVTTDGLRPAGTPPSQQTLNVPIAPC